MTSQALTTLFADGIISDYSFNCLLEAGDIVTLPMKSVSLVVAYSSMLFPKLFHSPALPGAPSIAYRLSVDWHRSKRCFCFIGHQLLADNDAVMYMYCTCTQCSKSAALANRSGNPTLLTTYPPGQTPT